MAKTRRLTIASMAAGGWVRINEVSNLNVTFVATCGGRVDVSRSPDGKTYAWLTNTDHIRIFIDMEGPTDLPFITHSSSGVGWFQLQDFPEVPLGRGFRESGGIEIRKSEDLDKLDFEKIKCNEKAQSY